MVNAKQVEVGAVDADPAVDGGAPEKEEETRAKKVTSPVKKVPLPAWNQSSSDELI